MAKIKNLESTSTGYHYKNSTTSWGRLGTMIDSDDYESWSKLLTREDYRPKITKEALEDFLNNDEEMVPIVKGYLYKYLEETMNDSDEVIKEVLRNRDEEIKKLKEENDHLKNKLEKLTTNLDQIEQRLSMMENNIYPYKKRYGDYFGDLGAAINDASYSYTTKLS